jgi:hypothetical protein
MSFHNYIFEIPIDKVIHISENMSNYYEMAKTLKIKNNKSEHYSITDLKGKLFSYYKIYINLIKQDCPQKGNRCPVNQVSKSFYLNNTPTYLNINVTDEIKSTTHLLKAFIMIPNLLELATIFQNSNKNKVFYELMGCICQASNKNYTCFFKQSTKWIHYNDEQVSVYESFFSVVSHCLKNFEAPKLLIFQTTEKYYSNESELTNEEILKLEQYSKNIDNLKQIIRNKFRPEEDFIEINLPNEDFEKKLGKRKNSENDNKDNSTSFISFYNCTFCGAKNYIDDILCIKCKKNNEKSIDIIKKKNNDSRVLKKDSSKSTLGENKNENNKVINIKKNIINDIIDKKSYNTVSEKFYPRPGDNLRKSREKVAKDYNLPRQVIPRADKSPDTRVKSSLEIEK